MDVIMISITYATKKQPLLLLLLIPTTELLLLLLPLLRLYFGLTLSFVFHYSSIERDSAVVNKMCSFLVLEVCNRVVRFVMFSRS